MIYVMICYDKELLHISENVYFLKFYLFLELPVGRAYLHV